MGSLPARAIPNQVISCDWHRRQTVAISADSDVNGSFVLEYMGFRSEQVRIFQTYTAHLRVYEKQHAKG